ncbi:hypothetical protein BLNAU_6168 [Blattamonas nauphoetae]|uniref:Uncharacterized protein n=1 Tax=Blattamonas nauphoetae TaxID=2049346 RepID=A0ABQ9Y5C6_9EUKA|nr:hypothetical protein BLNAU_6168 [Blattamonas nauphoetae]
MGRLNDFETVRKNAKERVRKGIDDLKATEEKYNQDGERLKQQGEELKKKADEFRQRAETIKHEAERHAANLKKESDEMWKTGKEEIEHAHEEEKEAISAAETKAKELKEKAKEAKKRMVARFNNLKKEEESVLSAAKDKLAALGMKMRAAQLARSPEQEKGERRVKTTRLQEAGGADESSGSAGEAPQGRAQAVAPEENGRGQTRAASDQTEHRTGTPLAAGRGEGAAATREERVRIEGG